MFEPLPLDVAPVPIMLELFAFPAILFFIIVLLIWLMVKLIRKISRSRKDAAWKRSRADAKVDNGEEGEK